MTYLILDSNIYLHAKFFADVPWNDLAKDDVCIVVPLMVVRELDDVKYSTKSTATKQRAAQVTKRLVALAQEAKASPLKTAPLRKGVTIQVQRKESRFPKNGSFNPKNQDDHIVLACRALRRKGVLLCTQDAPLTLKADGYDIPLLALPESLVQLPAADPAHKELEALLNRMPKVEVLVTIGGQPLTEGSEVQFMALRPATHDEVFMKAIHELHREEQQAANHRSDLMSAWDSEFGRDDPGERHTRQNDDLMRIQSGLHEELDDCEERGREVDLTVTVRNTGNVSANKVIIEMTTDAGITLVGPTRFELPCLMHTDSEVLPPMKMRFPKGFALGGSKLALSVLCNERPARAISAINFRVKAVPASPFHGMEE